MIRRHFVYIRQDDKRRTGWYPQAVARTPTLTFDRGTLILHPPPRGKAWVDFATWDDRVEKFRIPALQYRSLVSAPKDAGTEVNDKAKGFGTQPFEKTGFREPLAHQAEAQAFFEAVGSPASSPTA